MRAYGLGSVNRDRCDLTDPTSNKQSMLVVLGNQLFPIERVRALKPASVFMAEDMGLCTYERHHQQKIVLFLAAMRGYRDELQAAGLTVHYHQLDPSAATTYEEHLEESMAAAECSAIMHFEIEDKAMEARITRFASSREIPRQEFASPMFLCSRDRFREFANGKKTLRMADFYKQERLRQNLLIDASDGPIGGRWSFDEENRRKLPKDVEPPSVSRPAGSPHTAEVIELVSQHFADHPGKAAEFQWPVTREQSLAWLREFISERLPDFGPYEDAISTRSDTIFHSALSPMLNLGLLTAQEVVDAVLEHSTAHDVPLQSAEGFIRQIIGWREFVRGVYRLHSERQDEANYFGHERELSEDWYTGSTGIPPLDDTIRTALRLGWTHHIPRLMIVANLMTLCEIRPQSAHRWFMEMYVDSSEWVMGPNVYGMGLFSDGGIFATKPYICGSNYMRRMSDYPKGEWCDIVDGLYWRFIDKHRDFFAGNPRLALMPRALDRQSPERIEHIFERAEEFLQAKTRHAE